MKEAGRKEWKEATRGYCSLIRADRQEDIKSATTRKVQSRDDISHKENGECLSDLPTPLLQSMIDMTASQHNYLWNIVIVARASES
jgi:hypothetical protein